MNQGIKIGQNDRNYDNNESPEGAIKKSPHNSVI